MGLGSVKQLHQITQQMGNLHRPKGITSEFNLTKNKKDNSLTISNYSHVLSEQF